MAVPGIAGVPAGTSFGPANKDAFYQQVGQFRQNNSAEATANQFANNPYGVSFQELLGTPASAPTGGGGGGYAPVAAANPYIAQTQAAGNHLNDLYNQIFSAVPQDVARQRENLQGQYTNQLNGLNQAFATSSRVIPAAFSGRGLGDSSYSVDAVNDANNTYKNNLTNINNDQNQKLQQLAAFGDQALAKYHEGQNYLNSIMGNLQNNASAYAVNSLGSQAADAAGFLGSLGSGGKFASDLAQFAPTANNGAADLGAQVAKITGTTPQFGTQTVAGSAQAGTPGTADYWNNYYKYLG